MEILDKTIRKGQYYILIIVSYFVFIQNLNFKSFGEGEYAEYDDDEVSDHKEDYNTSFKNV